MAFKANKRKVFFRSVHRASVSKTFTYREQGEDVRTGLFSLRFQKTEVGVLSAAVTHAEGAVKFPMEFVKSKNRQQPSDTGSVLL